MRCGIKKDMSIKRNKMHNETYMKHEQASIRKLRLMHKRIFYSHPSGDDMEGLLQVLPHIIRVTNVAIKYA